MFNSAFANLSPEEVYSRLSSDKDEQGSSASGEGDPGGCGEVRDVSAEDGGEGSEADKREVETEWKVAVSQAANIAKGMGGLGAALDRVISEALKPVLNWKAILHRFVQEQVQKTQTWNPPDRRFIWQGILMPGLGGTAAGHIVVGVDTSGSISGDILNQFASEIQAIRDETGAELTIMYCSTKVARVDHFEREADVVISPAGSGGTAFAPVFERVEEEGIAPTCLIYLTDLEGSFPSVEPPYPVLWAVLGKAEFAPFGEIVRIK
jgi:predicted metal-dependent peptidase